MRRAKAREGAFWGLAAAVTVGGAAAWAEPPATQPAPSPRVLEGPRHDASPTTQPRRGFDGRTARADDGELIRELLADLKLTAEQQAKVREIVQSAMERRKAWHEEHAEEIERLRGRMQEARRNEDREAMRGLAPQMRELWQSAPKPRETLDKVREVLDQEQRTKLDERLEEKKEELRDRFGGPRGDGDRPTARQGREGERPAGRRQRRGEGEGGERPRRGRSDDRLEL